jgi:ketosteroid isomerase-like protein
LENDVNPEATKRMISEMFLAFDNKIGDPPSVLKDMVDDGEWWVAGTTAVSGSMNKQQLMDLMRNVGSNAEGGLKLVPRADSWIIEGDKVAVEVDSEMKLKDGREYRNEYHFRIQMRNGKILQVKEYLDTMCAAKFFG